MDSTITADLAQATDARRHPLCFVLMPFGKKAAPSGATIDFDAVYFELIKPAVKRASFEPLRADEELAGGIIHKPMFERLIICDFAVADLTTANANVFYELGVRHAVKSASTVMIYADGVGPLPFDVRPLRALPYTLGADGRPVDPAAAIEALTRLLIAARERLTDSPVFQLVDGFPDLHGLKTDVFRERVDYSKEVKSRLAIARTEGSQAMQMQAIRAIEAELSAPSGKLDDVETGVVIDLFLSYRKAEDFDAMIALVAKMPAPLATTVMVQEQYALALNRKGRGKEAERVLTSMISALGPSSETCGILGRVYKDRWKAVVEGKQAALASGLLVRAIDAYLQGFESDWRDHYPGINVVTLMEAREPPDPRGAALLPVVKYAVDRRIASGQPDYWDYATLLEIAVLQRDETAAADALASALALEPACWEAKSTLENISLILNARRRRGEAPSWCADIENELGQRARADANPDAS